MGQQERIQLLVIKWAIAELPQEQQDMVNECYQKLKETVTEYNKKSEDTGYMGFALFGGEISAGVE